MLFGKKKITSASGNKSRGDSKRSQLDKFTTMKNELVSERSTHERKLAELNAKLIKCEKEAKKALDERNELIFNRLALSNSSVTKQIASTMDAIKVFDKLIDMADNKIFMTQFVMGTENITKYQEEMGILPDEFQDALVKAEIMQEQTEETIQSLKRSMDIVLETGAEDQKYVEDFKKKLLEK